MLNINELKIEFENYLIEELKFSNEDAYKYSLKLLNDDRIHEVDEYMSEYIDETDIKGERYIHYHCWFEIEHIPFRVFEHDCYYLKEDLIDESVKTYINARKLYGR